jgi:hypothetical protein
MTVVLSVYQPGWCVVKGPDVVLMAEWLYCCLEQQICRGRQLLIVVKRFEVVVVALWLACMLFEELFEVGVLKLVSWNACSQFSAIL